jgi:hypothetical protein
MDSPFQVFFAFVNSGLILLNISPHRVRFSITGAGLMTEIVSPVRLQYAEIAYQRRPTPQNIVPGKLLPFTRSLMKPGLPTSRNI